jgi:23S rRNA (adenine2503-C2)-methyltransferase
MENTIKAYSPDGLQDLMAKLGQPRFRAHQLARWLYVKGITSFDEATNMPLSLRNTLKQAYPLNNPSLIKRQESRDGTRKYLLEFGDKVRVETVAIPSLGPESKRLTVCFSTQAGCAMACAFCATGLQGFTRNLLPGEILDQILCVQKDFGWRVSNLVAMGQGEPFLNYDHTLAALRFANSSKALGIGSRHITVSTCGILPGIRRFSREPEQFTLAISLHSAEQSTRDLLMGKLAHFPLTALKTSLLDYVLHTNRRVTLEYCLIENVNDTPDALNALIGFCSGLLCHVNLLPLNVSASSACTFRPSNKKVLNEWAHRLARHHIQATIRNSRGTDIQSACGQLNTSEETC